MTDRIRTLAEEALALNEKLAEVALDHQKAWRDAQLRAARALVDAVLPKSPKA